jgi:3-hydroxyacyl-CoA dehydrogenase
MWREEKMKIKKVCVIGMGTMGSQIGVVCAKGGCETAMVDTSSDQVERGLKNIQSFLQGQEKKGKIDQEAKDRVLSLITTGKDIPEAVKDADLFLGHERGKRRYAGI